MLTPSQVGCILGRGGANITQIRQVRSRDCLLMHGSACKLLDEIDRRARVEAAVAAHVASELCLHKCSTGKCAFLGMLFIVSGVCLTGIYEPGSSQAVLLSWLHTSGVAARSYRAPSCG